jgi:hypothetical protein
MGRRPILVCRTRGCCSLQLPLKARPDLRLLRQVGQAGW